MNCPNCGAIVHLNDNYCEYCGNQNFINIDDILNKPKMIKGGYVSEWHDDYIYDSYRTADGKLHRVKKQLKKTITITEE